METLVNCDIFIDIELIENISGANQYFEVFFKSKDNLKYKVIFDYVWDIRYSIENGYIDRFSKFHREAIKKSSILLIENSEYIKYFEKQASGTLPIEDIKNYILSDSVDSVIEILALKKPTLVKL